MSFPARSKHGPGSFRSLLIASSDNSQLQLEDLSRTKESSQANCRDFSFISSRRVEDSQANNLDERDEIQVNLVSQNRTLLSDRNGFPTP